MTRAVVIKIAGDRDIGCAIETGIRASLEARPPEPEARIVPAEMDQQRVRQLVRVAVGNTKTPDDYQMMTTKARAEYGGAGRAPEWLRKMAGWALGAYGLLVLGIAEAYRAQDSVLGRRA